MTHTHTHNSNGTLTAVMEPILIFLTTCPIPEQIKLELERMPSIVGKAANSVEAFVAKKRESTSLNVMAFLLLQAFYER